MARRRHSFFMQLAGIILVSIAPCRAQQSAGAHPDSSAPGAPIFASSCSGCHGADGRGGEHAPNIATAPQVQHLMDRELAGIIRYGVAGAGMPAFSSLKQQEVAEVVSYLRA